MILSYQSLAAVLGTKKTKLYEINSEIIADTWLVGLGRDSNSIKKGPKVGLVLYLAHPISNVPCSNSYYYNSS